MDYEKAFDIPFGAKDSELIEWEYNIPEGMEAIIDGDKVIIRKKESEDEKIRKEIIEYMCHQIDRVSDAPNVQKKYEYWIAWLEKH